MAVHIPLLNKVKELNSKTINSPLSIFECMLYTGGNSGKVGKTVGKSYLQSGMPEFISLLCHLLAVWC